MNWIPFSDVLAEPLRNGVYKPKELHGIGTSVVNMKELFAFDRIEGQATDRVKLEPAELDRVSLRAGDLLFARRSFVLEGAGKCSIVGSLPEPMTFESSMIRARLDRSQALPEFFFYFFKSPAGRDAMASIATRTAVSGITGANLATLPVPLPPLTIQRKVVSVLSAYDDLVKNNRRRIELLEEIPLRIYGEWFVEYRYPGHDDESGLSGGRPNVPASWRERDLRELGTITMGQSPPSSAYNTAGDGLPFHQGVGTFGEHFPVLTKYSRLGDRIAEPGDVLLSVRAPVGRINVADRKMILGRGLCGVRGDEAPTLFLLYALKHVFQEEDSMGGGSIFNAVTKRDVERIPILWPGRELVQAFAERAGETNALIANLTRANSVLLDSRDLLLPRLISGELDTASLDISGVEAAA